MATQSFYVKGKFPGLNDVISSAKRSHFAYANLKREWTGKVSDAAKKAGIEKMESVFLTLTWHEKNKRRDPDNVASAIKFVLDGLVKAEVLANDGWNQIIGWKNEMKINSENGVSIDLVS